MFPRPSFVEPGFGRTCPPALRLLAAGFLLAATFLLAAPARTNAGGPSRDFRIDILVDGRPVPQYATVASRGRYDPPLPRYVEALKGKDYAIRIHNPLGVRVAVALSVDGLNTIDARHTSARDARKWVLGPHETITISGWQTSLHEARRFYFTSEERSYAARLGERENLGVISAVFFRERVAAHVIPLQVLPPEDRGRAQSPAPGGTEGPKREAESGSRSAPSGGGRTERQAAPSPSTMAHGLGEVEARAKDAPAFGSADEYAATGIGDRTQHHVRQIHMDIEDVPVASVDVRYEYRAQLARLGLLLDDGGQDVLSRRGRARGFAGGFCPDMK